MIQSIAFATNDIDKQVELLMEAGYSRWVRDRIETAVYPKPDDVRSNPAEISTVRIACNYDILDGVEYEIVQHVSGFNFLKAYYREEGDIAYVSHQVDSHSEGADLLGKFGAAELIQESWTLDHANEKIPDNCSYLHRYYVCERFPQVLKLYMRVERDEALEHVRPEES